MIHALNSALVGASLLVAGAAHAQDTSSLTTAITATEQAGLASVVTSGDPYTIFTPTNDALAAAPVADLQGDELKNVILGHVVPGKVMAADAIKLVEDGGGKAAIQTASGATLTLSVDGGNVIVTDAAGNAATVTAADVTAGEVVVHVLDKAILPK